MDLYSTGLFAFYEQNAVVFNIHLNAMRYGFHETQDSCVYLNQNNANIYRDLTLFQFKPAFIALFIGFIVSFINLFVEYFIRYLFCCFALQRLRDTITVN